MRIVIKRCSCDLCVQVSFLVRCSWCVLFRYLLPCSSVFRFFRLCTCVSLSFSEVEVSAAFYGIVCTLLMYEWYVVKSTNSFVLHGDISFCKFKLSVVLSFVRGCTLHVFLHRALQTYQDACTGGIPESHFQRCGQVQYRNFEYCLDCCLGNCRWYV